MPPKKSVSKNDYPDSSSKKKQKIECRNIGGCQVIVLFNDFSSLTKKNNNFNSPFSHQKKRNWLQKHLQI